MKKIIVKIFIMLLPMFFINGVNAANATISVTSSSNQVIVGKSVTVYVTISSSSPIGSWEYTLNYNNSLFKLTSSDVALHYASYASNPNTKSITYKYNFTALKSGNAKFYVDSSAVIGWDESIFSVTDGSKTINTLTYSEYQASLSANNNLKSLTIDGYEITPEFNKDTLEYTVQVSEEETMVKISAVPEDKTASVSGDGEVEVSAGNNVFDILVIAQNGSEKTYKLNVEVIDKDPIIVDLENKRYSVVKIAANLIKPESYTETTIVINEYDIPAFYSEVTEFTLVGLKDDEGKVSLFIYHDGEYKPYYELIFGNITIYPTILKDVKKGFQKENLKIQEIEIEALSLNKKSRFKLIYGLNVETKEEGFYQYDTKDNTLIKYDEEYINVLQEKNNMLMYSTIAFISSTILALFGIIGMSKKKKVTKTKRLINELSDETNEIKETVKEESKEENEIIEKKEAVYDIFEDDKPKKKKKSKSK